MRVQRAFTTCLISKFVKTLNRSGGRPSLSLSLEIKSTPPERSICSTSSVLGVLTLFQGSGLGNGRPSAPEKSSVECDTPPKKQRLSTLLR